MSDEEMDQECPDFNQIKNSPPCSPSQSPRSTRENSVILEPRDVALSQGKYLQYLLVNVRQTEQQIKSVSELTLSVEQLSECSEVLQST